MPVENIEVRFLAEVSATFLTKFQSRLTSKLLTSKLCFIAGPACSGIIRTTVFYGTSLAGLRAQVFGRPEEKARVDGILWSRDMKQDATPPNIHFYAS
jgi:hypothetical protein